MKKKLEEPKRWRLLVALLVFVTTSVLGVVVNSFCFGKGLHLDWSVSRYVGSEVWSAIIFALGNVVVSAMMGKYLWQIGRMWKMPRVYYYFALLMLVGLIMLSVFPIGFFDVGGQKSIQSYIHEVSSRTMFLMMLFIAGMLILKRGATKSTRIWAMLYVAYGVFCVVGYLTAAGWFWPGLLIYESVYVAAFPLLLMTCRVRAERV